MSDVKSILNGVVHGKTIELENESGFPDGQEVRITIQLVNQRQTPGEGLQKSFGAWADEAEELERYLEWNRQHRKISRAEMVS